MTSSAHSTLQLTLEGSRGVVNATIDRVGASLNSADVAGVDVVPRWNPDSSRPFSAGVTLAPWPNRIRDGKWQWEGEALHLKVSEPERHTALHGLVTGVLWDVAHQSSSAVILRTGIEPSSGYPFSLELSVSYRLDQDGVVCEVEVVNRGEHRAPCAVGFHPFMCLGDRPVRSLTLHSPVTEVVTVDDRLLPIGLADAMEAPHNPAGGVPLIDAQFDTGFRLGGKGSRVTTLSADDGAAVELWQSQELGWIQFFLTDDFPGEQGPQSALAVEPMSAPADAFNSGLDVWQLEPGQTAGATWGIRLV